jgi:hypothetical protein
MTRLISLLTAAIALAACSSPTAPRNDEQNAAAARAKSALAAGSQHANGRLAAN